VGRLLAGGRVPGRDVAEHQALTDSGPGAGIPRAVDVRRGVADRIQPIDVGAIGSQRPALVVGADPVYLPFGYTNEEQYNVFYLMHGGWSNETGTLGTPDRPSDFKNVLDNAIAAGQIKPLIVVCPTYNNTSAQDSANFGLALTLNQNYHHELLGDLIPAVEGRYSSYAKDVSPDGLKAARDHRGFGGFSMGAVATWRSFQYGLDYFRYFLPMSCGTSLDMDNILAVARDHDPADYFVGIITGTDDFAHPYDQDRAELMRDSATFTEARDGQDGNFAIRVKDGYSHNGVAATEYTYNGLRWFWNR
jgi:hypothetical protein